MDHQAEIGILSIVIPTLNEAARLPALLADLSRWPAGHEIIVADGGSTDGTADLAQAAGCRVVSCLAGRGTQLREGARLARGEWLLFLHADVRLSAEALDEAATAIRDPSCVAAAWPLRLDIGGWPARLIEWGAAVRWRLAGLAYGDQGLLIRREVYHRVGGFPDLPLMEDVVLVRRLRREGGVRHFRLPIVADARRYLREGWLRRMGTNTWLLTLFSLGVPAERLVARYRPEPAPR